jgi:hypothetical protein
MYFIFISAGVVWKILSNYWNKNQAQSYDKLSFIYIIESSREEINGGWLHKKIFPYLSYFIHLSNKEKKEGKVCVCVCGRGGG